MARKIFHGIPKETCKCFVYQEELCCRSRAHLAAPQPHSQPPAQLPVACSMVKREGVWYIFSCEWRHGQGKLCERGLHVNHKKLRPHARTAARLFRVERWQRTKALLCRSSRDSLEDREFYQAKTVKTHSNNLVVLTHVQLMPFYPWRHSREKMYQALSHFTVL